MKRTIIFSGSFEKMEDAESLTSNDPITPRTNPIGTERLSRRDFLASRLKYLMCPKGNKNRK